jgi:hypothetical protein
LGLTDVRSLHAFVEDAKKVPQDTLNQSDSTEAVASEAKRAAERKQNVSSKAQKNASKVPLEAPSDVSLIRGMISSEVDHFKHELHAENVI